MAGQFSRSSLYPNSAKRTSLSFMIRLADESMRNMASALDRARVDATGLARIYSSDNEQECSEFLKVGDFLRPVRKCMGLRPGEKISVLRDPIRVLNVRREPLRMMTDDLDYGFEEVRREGFARHPDYHAPGPWVAMFCATHKGCTLATVITRIEFSHEASQ